MLNTKAYELLNRLNNEAAQERILERDREKMVARQREAARRRE
jgi:hypothetical protein